MDRLDKETFGKCFPKLAKLMADTETRVAAEAKAEAERREAEAERQRQEELKRAAAAREAAEIAAQRQAEIRAEEASPAGQVRQAIRHIFLRVGAMKRAQVTSYSMSMILKWSVLKQQSGPSSISGRRRTQT